MPTRAPTAQYFKGIRSWEGAQSRAFEELCFQLRDREPDGVELRKTDDPDGGLEWYWVYPDGGEVGWQCKFSDDEKSLMGMMDRSFESVRTRRPNATRLTFCISVDLSDDPDGSRGEFGWQRYERLREKWKEKAPHLEVALTLGGEILERLVLKEHAGREWFWFGAAPILHNDWCRDQLKFAIESVDERYRPDLNVELPVASTVAAVAQPAQLRARFDEIVADTSECAADVLRYRPNVGPFAAPLGQLAQAAAALVAAAHEAWTPQRPLSEGFGRALADATQATSDLMNIAYEEAGSATAALHEDGTNAEARDRLADAYTRERDADRLQARLAELEEWSTSAGYVASSSCCLLLDGGGGVGKTHLFCEVAGQLIDEGHPVLLLLGQWFGSDSPWRTLAERLGDPSLSIEEVVVALESSAEAADKRMVLMIDAINDAADETIWKRHLRELGARLSESRWVGVALSCRTTYLDGVMPREGFGPFTRMTHLGFAGREFEGIARIFGRYGVLEPRVAVLNPEFTNPLFLILYAKAIAGGRIPDAGGAHLTAVFNGFVEALKADITGAAPELDGALDPVGKAMQAIGSELARRGRDHLPYEQASEIVSAFDTSGARWPQSLFGRMLSTGLLARDRAYMPDENRHGQAVRFPFQRFSDHLIVGGMLDAHLDENRPLRSFAAGEPLHDLLAQGPLGAIEALAIQLPERTGIELPDVAHDTNIAEWRKHRVLQAFVESLPVRDPDAGRAERIFSLLETARADHLTDEVTGAIIACAPIPDHPLNGDWLHDHLSMQAVPERDANWLQPTYWCFGDTAHPLDRLIRWAERGPYPDYDDTLVELAALPLAWTLGSPNRFARDAATKALATLFVGHLELAERTARRFVACDDPYVTERLAAAAYGAILRQDAAAADAFKVTALLATLVEMLEQGRPNILLRDHVAGIARYLRDYVGHPHDELIERALPPYGASSPTTPRDIDELEELYERRGPNNEIGYGGIISSLFTDMGDFHKYVMSGDVRRFQHEFLGSSEPPPATPRDRWMRQYPTKLAAAYIFERVLELGWTPDVFGEFDASVRRADRGRDSHKPERFGKKYQWIGLFELLARLADNHIFVPGWSDAPQPYSGAWQLSARDIDPTLPPARVRIREDERMRDPVFAPDPPRAWWVPAGPDFDRATAGSGEWAKRMDDLPTADELFCRKDVDGTRWVVLGGRLDREEHRDPIADDKVPRRSFGASIHAALVRLNDLDQLQTWFNSTTDVMRSLPGWDVQAWGYSYLGEVPFALAAQDLNTGWHIDEYQHDPKFPHESLQGAVPWHWAAGLDCSLDSALNVTLPSPQLITRGLLRRDPDLLSWRANNQQVVRFVETDEGWHRDWALLARENWLLELLAREGLAFVAGSYAERRVLGAELLSHDVLGWVDYGAGALIEHGNWHRAGPAIIWDRDSGTEPPRPYGG